MHNQNQISSILGLDQTATAAMVKQGFHTSVVDALSDYLAIPRPNVLAHLNISTRTFARRQSNKRLNPEESDRVWRAARIIAKATDLFKDSSAASTWVRLPVPALSGESPLDCSSTSIGAREVEEHIGRLQHGIPT